MKSCTLTMPLDDDAGGLTPRVCVTTAARLPSASMVGALYKTDPGTIGDVSEQDCSIGGHAVVPE